MKVIKKLQSGRCAKGLSVKLLSIGAAAVIAFTATANVNAAINFYDQKDIPEWARDAIYTMTDKGIISGMTDDNINFYFRPNYSVKKLDALILTSKILGANEEKNRGIVEKAENLYSAALNRYNLPYGEKDVAYLLYNGVLQENELDDYISTSNLQSPMARYEAAMLMVKALGKETEVKNKTLVILPFVDQDSIPEKARPYIDYALKEKVMVGISETEFAPFTPLTRAQISVLLSKIMDRVPRMQESIVTGRIVAKDQDKQDITIKLSDGQYVTYSLADALVRLDESAAQYSDLVIGMMVDVKLKDQAVLSAEGEKIGIGSTVYGYVTYTTMRGTDKKIGVKPVGETGSSETEYTLDPYVIVYKNDQLAGLDGVQSSDYVKIEMDGEGKPFRVTAQLKNRSVSGTISAITSDNMVKLSVVNSSNQEETYALSDDLVVTRNGLPCEFKDLRVGDKVKIDLEYDKARLITATGSVSTIQAVIEEVSLSSNPKITVKDDAGNIKQYAIMRDTEVRVGGIAKSFYDLRVGMRVKLTLESNTVTLVEGQEVNAVDHYTGVIEAYNKSVRVLTITTAATATEPAAQKQLFLKNDSVMVTDAKTGGLLNFDALKQGVTISAFGSTELGVFIVTQIVVVSK